MVTGRAALPAAAPPRAAAGEPMLASKLSPPRLPGWLVRRERLDKLLSAGGQGPLTVVTGPPGAGKSLAIAAWAAAAPGRIAWLNADSFDNSPATFWRYLTGALQRAGTPLPADLAAPVSGPPEQFLRRLAALLAGGEPTPLVLDDLHVLTGRAVLDGLGYVLRHAGGGLRLIAAARMDPLRPLYRYRLAGELAEIRTADLAFTAAEAQQLLAQHGITLPAASVAELTRRNEGWAAGLRLAALSLAGHPDPERFVREFSADDAAITGYLIDEVLGQLPPGARDLLLKTSILERVSDELACELAGSDQAAGVLPDLAQRNCFIRPLGHGWYRFHSLFAEALQLKLRREAPHQVPQLRRRAARWLQQHGTVLEATRQAAAAGDWQLAARIAVSEFAVGAILDPLAAEPLAALFRRLPAGEAGGLPAGCVVAAAVAVRDHRGEAARSWLDRAEAALAGAPADAGLPARLAAAEIRFSLARRAGEAAAAVAAAAEAQQVAGAMPAELHARHPEVGARVAACCGVAEMWAGSLAGAAALLADAAAGARWDYGWADCLGQRALAEAARGKLHRAAELAATATATGPAAAGHPAASRTAAGEVALAWACVERGQLSESGAHLARAEDVLRARPDRLLSGVASLVTARQRLARGDLQAAGETARRARGGWSPPAWLDRELSLAESLAFTAAGDIWAAVAAASRVAPSEALEAAVAQSRVLLAIGNLGAARRVLACAPAAAGGEVPGYVRLEARLLEAELAYRGEDPAGGRRALEKALRLAEREQLRLPVWMQRAWIHPVLRRDPGLAGTFRAFFGPLPPPPAPAGAGGDGPAGPLVVESLSAKEREVLQHAAAMLSTAEIAAGKYVSVNTVKSHFKSIVRKLGANHRGEAVRRAQQLNLL